MKFSIIIPVHNASGRIRKALDIITAQTLPDYELICVCDACTDDSADICREYTKKVFEVDYGNDGLARSKGLDEASGEWVLFHDDDDWWVDNSTLEMINFFINQRTDADVICFGFIWQGYGVVKSIQDNGSDWVNVWSKAWRRSAIDDTRFPNVHSISDYEFTKLMYMKNISIIHRNEAFYYYNWLRPGSISETDRREKK